MSATRWHRYLAWVWLFVVGAAVAYNAKVWLGERRSLETDFMALLPTDETDPVVSRALSQVAVSAEQNVLVLVGAPDWTQAREAGRQYQRIVARDSALLSPASMASMGSDSALAPWWNHRHGLLTADDRSAMRTAVPGEWTQRALHDLLSPLGTGRVGSWKDDPFALFQHWLRARAADTPVRPVDGVLRVDDGDMHYVVLPLRLRAPAFALQAQRRVVPLFVEARAAALGVAPTVRVLEAGMVFPAAAAAKQANREFSTIGWGSILGIVIVTWLTFRSLRPIGLILLSLGVGTIAAMAVTAWWYPNIHLLTLVFGSSLIGVGEDYGAHFLCMSDRRQRGAVLAVLDALPGLSLALLTTLASFLGLAISPFPGLQQMALFSSVGLASTWLTVVLWFPVLDGPQVGSARVIQWFDRVRERWERVALGRLRGVLGLSAAVLVVIGLVRLHANDDIRLLQSLPEDMIREQTAVGRVLNTPFAAQTFVIRAASAQETLEREEALRLRLDSLVAQNALVGYQAASQWVPSRARQQLDAALVAKQLFNAGGEIDRLGAALGEGASWTQDMRVVASRQDSIVTPDDWLASPMSAPLRHLWLGQVGTVWGSVVTLKGVETARMTDVARAAQGLPGVVWADRIDSISLLLGRYRVRMSWVLAVSYLIVWLMFLPRYGRAAWRVLAPSVCASVIAVATLGLLGQPLQLFHILGLFLVFGIGVDYAIFLTEHRHSPPGDAWFAVGLASISTLLSLGLLALSETPVLRAFGATMLIGITVSTFASPLFCRTSSHSPVSDPAGGGQT